MNTIAPTIMLIPEETPYWIKYIPANRLAEHLAAFAGIVRISQEQIPHLEAARFKVIVPNGQPLPHPRTATTAYARRNCEPRHILDEA